MKKMILRGLLLCLLLCAFGTTAFAAEKHPYYVTVNLTDNIVTVYEQDENGDYTVPKKAFLCSVGESTPEGTFQTMVKYDWRYLFGDVWGQYATRITGHYLFHSVPYFEKDKSTLEYEEYNKLGTTASMGCIRLTVKDAKWLYDNCPVGTTVKMYRGDVEEPLQPAPVQKLNVNDVERRGWDPTDPDPANPWRKGELREMQVEPSLLNKKVETYYENGTYYISAEDAAEVFLHADVKAKLPDGLMEKDEITITNENGSYFVNCRTVNGISYFKIRDVAAIMGTEMVWNKETKEISILDGEKTITLTRVQQDKKEESFAEKITAIFQG
ncbi:L,D-transpeptidase family protein [Anaerotignum sp.]